MNPLLSRLHAVNPYDGFCSAKYPEDTHGWNSDHPIFARLISEVRPSLLCEVGVWKGASTLTMARAIKEQALPTTILCVDTWLGSAEMWTDQNDPERYLSLRLEHGYPTVYYQFLANMVRNQLQDIVVPFPQTSSNATEWLGKVGLEPELVYLDASHSYLDVMRDIQDWYPIIKPGGLLFGDDFDEYWPDLCSAVKDAAGRLGTPYEIDGNKWIIRKPL